MSKKIVEESPLPKVARFWDGLLHMQAILMEPRTGADAPVWRGPLSGEKTEAALTMSAYAFDTLVSAL